MLQLLLFWSSKNALHFRLLSDISKSTVLTKNCKLIKNSYLANTLSCRLDNDRQLLFFKKYYLHTDCVEWNCSFQLTPTIIEIYRNLKRLSIVMWLSKGNCTYFFFKGLMKFQKNGIQIIGSPDMKCWKRNTFSVAQKP